MYGNSITAAEVPPFVQSMVRKLRHEEALAFCARKLEVAAAQVSAPQWQARPDKRPVKGADAPPLKKPVAATKPAPPGLAAPKSGPAAATPATNAVPVKSFVPPFSPLHPTPKASRVLSPWSTLCLTLHAPEGDGTLAVRGG